MRRRRAPLVVGLVVLVVVASLLVARGRTGQPTSPFDGSARSSSLLMAEAAEEYYEIRVLVAKVCAPGTTDVPITGVRLLGVDGDLALARFSPRVVTTPCGTGRTEDLVARVRRDRGESAHADGFEVVYELDGREGIERVSAPVTLCRQLSEC